MSIDGRTPSSAAGDGKTSHETAIFSMISFADDCVATLFLFCGVLLTNFIVENEAVFRAISKKKRIVGFHFGC
jgi:hypothetical protein